MFRRTRPLLIVAQLFLAAFFLEACLQTVPSRPDPALAVTTPRDIPTWTPIPKAETAHGKSEPFKPTETLTPFFTSTAINSASVTLEAVDGNLNIRRGPSVDYSPIGVLVNGESVVAIGRDRVSRWLYVEVNTISGSTGWVSTLTDFSKVSGDVDRLPVVTEEPAIPAFIRNCTKHTMWILPAEVELLPKWNEPYNEERFPPGEYQVYDLDFPSKVSITKINLREGSFVDIVLDGEGDKSKCK